MNPPTNTGSFGAAAGGITSELQEALQRRASGGQGATAAVTQGAPTMNPQTQPAQAPQGQPPTMAPAQSGAPAGQSPEAPALPFDSVESKMIIGALTNRLKAGSKFHGVQ